MEQLIWDSFKDGNVINASQRGYMENRYCQMSFIPLIRKSLVDKG